MIIFQRHKYKTHILTQIMRGLTKQTNVSLDPVNQSNLDVYVALYMLAHHLEPLAAWDLLLEQVVDSRDLKHYGMCVDATVFLHLRGWHERFMPFYEQVRVYMTTEHEADQVAAEKLLKDRALCAFVNQ